VRNFLPVFRSGRQNTLKGPYMQWPRRAIRTGRTGTAIRRTREGHRLQKVHSPTLADAVVEPITAVAINSLRDYVCRVAILLESWGATRGCYDIFPLVIADEYLPHGYLYRLNSNHMGTSKGFCPRYLNRGWS